MKTKFFGFALILLITYWFVSDALPAPTSLPIPDGQYTQLGSGTFNMISGGGDYNYNNGAHKYDITDMTLTILKVRFEYQSGATDVHVLGGIQLYQNSTQILAQYAAGSHDSAENPKGMAYTWYQVTTPPNRYHTLQPAANGNAGSAGGVNDCYVAGRTTTWFEYYIGFDTPQLITEVWLGNGDNRFITYDTTFYGYNEYSTMPEPATMILFGTGLLGVSLRRRKNK